MLETVRRGRHLGHAGFAIKSCARRSRSKQTVFWTDLVAVRADALMRRSHNRSAQIPALCSSEQKLAPANSRKQKSQQALTR
jgi:hypothetical protein